MRMKRYEVWIKVVGERGEWVQVDSSAEAGRLVRSILETAGLGSGEWQGGRVRDVMTRRTVGRVSPNGRVWENRPHPHAREVTF